MATIGFCFSELYPESEAEGLECARGAAAQLRQNQGAKVAKVADMWYPEDFVEERRQGAGEAVIS